MTVVVLGGAFSVAFLVVSLSGTLGGDATSYYRLDFDDLYGNSTRSLVGLNAFRYSPAFAEVVSPLWILPWPAFLGVWMSTGVLAVLAMGRRRCWWLLLIPAVGVELVSGNIHLLITACVVFGFRWPALWAFVILTKVSPGIGILWFAFRHEWRNLAVALGATAAVALVSYVIAPTLWSDWLRALQAMSGLPGQAYISPDTLPVRLILATVGVWWAARRDARWFLPLAAMLALPSVWAISWAMLAGCVALQGGPTDRARLPVLGARWRRESDRSSRSNGMA